MMRFLKSTLFPSMFENNTNKDRQLALLKQRVKCLEEENKKSAEAIQELSTCIRSISFVMTDLASEVSVLSAYFNSLPKKASYDDDILSRYLKNSDDDDDGYLN